MTVAGIDHVALPTADAERLLAFYLGLGFGCEGADDWRAGRAPTFSITCGDNKLSIHPETLAPHRNEPWYLRGVTAQPGCADVCFVWHGGIPALLARLRDQSITPIKGPVKRLGGRSAGQVTGSSVYIRDPDDNLIEFISYDPADSVLPTGERR